MAELRTTSAYSPTGDQPQAIEKLADGIVAGEKFQTLVGATGTVAELEAVRRDYGVFATKADDAGWFWSHSSSIFLIDRAGTLRAMMPYGQPAEAYVHDVRILLGAAGPS